MRNKIAGKKIEKCQKCHGYYYQGTGCHYDYRNPVSYTHLDVYKRQQGKLTKLIFREKADYKEKPKKITGGIHEQSKFDSL